MFRVNAVSLTSCDPACIVLIGFIFLIFSYTSFCSLPKILVAV